MPIPLYLIPEIVGDIAGLADWGMSAAGYGSDNTIRQWLDSIDNMGLINSTIEGFGVLPTIENKGIAPTIAGEVAGFVPWFVPGPGAAAKAAEKGARFAPSVAGVAWGTAKMAPIVANAVGQGGRQTRRPDYGGQESAGGQGWGTVRGQNPGQPYQGGWVSQDAFYDMPTAIGMSTAETLRRAAENYPAMWERAQIIQNMRDAANRRAMMEAQQNIMNQAAQAFTVPQGAYPIY